MPPTLVDRPAEGHEFSRLQRLALGALGVGLTCAGTVAVFTTENGTGSAALIAAGLLAALISLVGRLVGLKVGAAEASFGRLAREVEAVEEQLTATAEEQESVGDDETAEAIRESAERLEAVRRGLEKPGPSRDEQYREQVRLRESYERAVVETVGQIARDTLPMWEVRTGHRGKWTRWDGYLVGPSGAIGLDVRYLPPGRESLTAIRVRDWAGRVLLGISTADRPTRALMVVPAHVELGDLSALTSSVPTIRIVGWSPGDQPGEIGSAR